MSNLSVEFYKKQASKLKKSYSLDDLSFQRVNAWKEIENGKITLADAQFVIAREQGFSSWPKFKKYIEENNFDGVRFKIFGRLKKFLGKPFQSDVIDLRWEEHRTLKDWIESLGIPHTEIGLVKVDTDSADLNSRLPSKCVVEVFEIEGPYDPRTEIMPGQTALGSVKFIADVHLGKLVRYLRILGLDCLYEEPWDDHILAQKAHDQKRIMLSRDMGLLQRKCISHGQFLHSDAPIKQAQEILKRYKIYDLCQPMSRCVSCNAPMNPVDKVKIEHLIEKGTKASYDKFFQCTSCSKVYWHGAHVKNILKTLREITDGVVQD